MASPELPSVARRHAVIDRFRAGGGRIAAVLPIHYPRAVFRAHNILPVEVWGPPGVDTSKGDAHLQAYTCSVVRSSLAFINSGGLDITDVIVVPHGCDSLQGLGSVLLDFTKPRQPVRTFYLPRGPRAAALPYLAEAIHALSDSLQEVSGHAPSNAELLAAIRREEEADAVLAELLDARARLPFSDHEIYRVARAREYLPAEDFVTAARAMLLAAAAEPQPRGLPLVLSGMLPEPMTLFDAITDAGGCVVADDLACVGRRRYPAGAGDDPWLRLAQSLLDGPPDPSRGSSTADRLTHLQHLVDSTGARAVLFYAVKFCEPEQFYLPQLRQGLEARGITSVVIEADIAEPLASQTVTRLEALLETVA